MKKLIKIIWAVALLFTSVSCDDFLTEPPVDKLTSDGFYETPTQADQGVVGIYACLRDIAHNEYLYLSECRSDNAWTEPLSSGIRDYAELSTFRASQELEIFDDVWNLWYKVIYNSNVLISKIPNSDFSTKPDLKNQLMGEAYFLHGWAYFELARLYGNIPLIDSPKTPAEVQTISQSPAREIYDKIIIPDLIEAKKLLPLNADLKNASGASISKTGRADRIAAQALLGRVYMTLSGFPHNDASAQTLAEGELKAVIDFSESNSDIFWAPNITEWRKQWIPDDSYYNKYSIFAIQYRGGGTGNKAPFYFSPKLPPSYTSYTLFGNVIHVEKSLMYEFDRVYTDGGVTRKDARGEGHSILTGYEAEGSSYPEYTKLTEKLTLPDGTQVDVLTTSMFYKFMPSKRKIAELGMSVNAEANMKGSNDWTVNLPIIRYEDVLLMYAEILASKNDIAGAMKIVNDIRERANCEAEVAATVSEAMYYIKRGY